MITDGINVKRRYSLLVLVATAALRLSGYLQWYFVEVKSKDAQPAIMSKHHCIGNLGATAACPTDLLTC